MTELIAYQCDRLGFLAGEVTADWCQIEEGVFHVPAGAVMVAPPDEWPETKWPRWNGSAWVLANKPKSADKPDDPVAKLQAFLNSNPDVAALLQSNDGGADV